MAFNRAFSWETKNIKVIVQGLISFNKIILEGNQKHERGERFKFKIHILFYGNNSWTVTFRQMTFGTVKEHVHSYRHVGYVNTALFTCTWTSYMGRIYVSLIVIYRSRGSSVSIVSDYGLDDQVMEVRSRQRQEDFSFNLCFQTGSRTHPSSCSVCTEGIFSGVKRGLGMILTIYPHLMPRPWMSNNYTSSPPLRLHKCVVGLLYIIMKYKTHVTCLTIKFM
jgi:hypothetical protein